MKTRNKNLILIGLLWVCMCLSHSAKSQVLISLIFGDKINSEKNLFGIHFNESLNSISNFEGTKAIPTFNLGLFFTHKLNEQWMINVEALPKYRKGAKDLAFYSLEDPNLDQIFSMAEINRQINYLGLPISARYLLKDRWFVETGPQINFRLGATDIFTKTSNEDEVIYKKDIREEVARWDFGYVAGIGFLLGKNQENTLGIRYHGGLTDVLPDYPGTNSHAQWAIYTNLPIGRGKVKDH
ncbi:porin family protein [Algoriphagus taiwanensis]|uniref:Outer membrane protein beta-barrel domain-containing protein n=1 Tax=Algoriphagus taiwanensis TaxID=1445656 RepID=A0ABQ6Q2V4_9BACT|nr:hypothetical protein Ataiwa_24880 [Algoriphagus taiwanensis]